MVFMTKYMQKWYGFKSPKNLNIFFSTSIINSTMLIPDFTALRARFSRSSSFASFLFWAFKTIPFLHIFCHKNHIVDIYIKFGALINRCHSIAPEFNEFLHNIAVFLHILLSEQCCNMMILNAFYGQTAVILSTNNARISTNI
ncbi:hypothetical protein U3516DRAFT_732920 [Neocallimastix sp. 'constans']